MKALVQRVKNASVTVDEVCVAKTSVGMLVFIGVEQTDTEQIAANLLDRLLSYRIFSDADGRMNLDLLESRGELLLVPQFTLVADTTKGRRPGFSHAASPDHARSLFAYLCDLAPSRVAGFGAGQFGADMQVSLVNDGPVTFWMSMDS